MNKITVLLLALIAQQINNAGVTKERAAQDIRACTDQQNIATVEIAGEKIVADQRSSFKTVLKLVACRPASLRFKTASILFSQLGEAGHPDIITLHEITARDVTGNEIFKTNVEFKCDTREQLSRPLCSGIDLIFSGTYKFGLMHPGNMLIKDRDMQLLIEMGY